MCVSWLLYYAYFGPQKETMRKVENIAAQTKPRMDLMQTLPMGDISTSVSFHNYTHVPGR